VAFHGCLADHEFRRDLGIREALRYEAEHFGLPGVRPPGGWDGR
jgi:hypothetical protein